MSLSGKVALVTGASRGIGAAIADTLAQEGATVIGTATSEKGAASITQRLSGIDAGSKGVVLNVNNSQDIESLVKRISADQDAPTILVNNAGITKDNLMLRMKEEEWDAVIATNLTAVYRTCRACLRGMTKARWGRVINISSVVGSMGNAGQCNYAATKAGIEGFSKSLAREIGARGITVNTVAPGFIDTDMTRDLDESQRQAMFDTIPLQRLGKPEEIGQVVAFLASEGAGYITGETIQVNGGMYMK